MKERKVKTIEVIYKEAAAEHALCSAWMLYQNGHIIGAHVLASAAFEVMEKVTNDVAGFSTAQAFWKALEKVSRESVEEKSNEEGGDALEINFNKKIKKNRDFVKSAYNYFKHADRDLYKEIHFDKTLTEHILYITTIDLEILMRNRPEKDGYRLSMPKPATIGFGGYLAHYSDDPKSLAALQHIIKDGKENFDRYVGVIADWIKFRTDIISDT